MKSPPYKAVTRLSSLEAATPLTALCLTYAAAREISAHLPGAAQHFSSAITWNYEITIRSGLDFTIADPLCAHLRQAPDPRRIWQELA